MIICPNCKSILKKYDKVYKCSNNHSFDIAKEGYVNLLLNKSSSGDNLEMIRARKEFLEKGFFDPLIDKLIYSINNLKLNNPSILDIGCADGYYTNTIANFFPNTVGIDISKDAIKLAAKKYKNLKFIVASAKDLPIKDSSCDVILNVFAPHFPEEFLRVLKINGYLIKVTPNKNHLLELKEILYEDVYLTKEKSITEDDLIEIHNEDLTYQIDLENKDILNVFTMTPYSHTTGKNANEKLSKINNLRLTIDFNISILKKHSKSN